MGGLPFNLPENLKTLRGRSDDDFFLRTLEKRKIVKRDGR